MNFYKSRANILSALGKAAVSGILLISLSGNLNAATVSFSANNADTYSSDYASTGRTIPKMLTLVPPGHWSYAYMDGLIQRNILNPGELYHLGKIITRRDAAILTTMALTDLEKADFSATDVSHEDLVSLQKLILEYSDELAQLFSSEISGVTRKVSQLEKRLNMMPELTHMHVVDHAGVVPEKEPAAPKLRSFDVTGNFRVKSDYVWTGDRYGFNLDHPNYDLNFNEEFHLNGRVDEKVLDGENPSRIDFDLKGYSWHEPGMKMTDWDIRWRDEGHDFSAGRFLGVTLSPLTLYDQHFEGVDWKYQYGYDSIRGVAGRVDDSSGDQEQYSFVWTRNHSKRFRNEAMIHHLVNYPGTGAREIANNNILSWRSTGYWAHGRRLSFEAARSQFHRASNQSGIEGSAFRVESVMGFKKANVKAEFIATGSDFLNLTNRELMPERATALYSRNDGRIVGAYMPQEGVLLRGMMRQQSRSNTDSDCKLKIMEGMADFKIKYLPRLMVYASSETDKGTDTGSNVDTERLSYALRGIYEGVSDHRTEASYRTSDFVDFITRIETVEREAYLDLFRELPRNWDANAQASYRWTERIANDINYRTNIGMLALGAGYDLNARNRLEGSFSFEKGDGYESYRIRESRVSGIYNRNLKNRIEVFASRKRRDDKAYPTESYLVDHIGLEWVKGF